MKLIEWIKSTYQPKHEHKEYVVSRVATHDENPNLETLNIEITASPEVVRELHRRLVSQAYTMLAMTTDSK